jgi:outer membrane protein
MHSLPIVLAAALAAAPAAAQALAAPPAPPASTQATPAPPQQQPPAAAQPPALPGATAPAGALPPAARVLTLDEAIRIARTRAPQLRQALGSSDAASARAREAFSGLLPQVSGTARYQRTRSELGAASTFGTSGVAGTGGVSGLSTTPVTSDFWGFSATATQLLFDFGQTTGHYAAAQSTAEGQAATATETLVSTALAVRTAYFQARATKDLVGVARATLGNQEVHLVQIRAFVDVGTRPPIDLAQARTNVANAKVQLVQAENNYDTARARLRQVMGVEDPIDWDVSDERYPPIEGEDEPGGALLAEALRRRPDLVASERFVQAADQTISATRGGYFPSIGLQGGATEQGAALDALHWSVFGGATLTWSLYQGGLTRAQVSEARANLDVATAQRDAVRQQVTLDVDTARLAVRAAKASLLAANDAVVNAREQLRLAEGRYRTGAGSSIELSDAQLAATNAEAQAVQADYQLATARAQLLAALGRDGA